MALTNPTLLNLCLHAKEGHLKYYFHILFHSTKIVLIAKMMIHQDCFSANIDFQASMKNKLQVE